MASSRPGTRVGDLVIFASLFHDGVGDEAVDCAQKRKGRAIPPSDARGWRNAVKETRDEAKEWPGPEGSNTGVNSAARV